MKTVLAPIDFSDSSRRVIDEAIHLARSIGGRLVLLHIVGPTSAFPSEFDSTGARAAYLAEAEKHARDELSALQRSLRDEGVTAHVVHLIAQPGPGILEQADRLEADYIVMGSHGHGAFYELIVGGTASRVLKLAKCPVVIVPSQAKKSARSGRSVTAANRATG
ncbi:MAG: universal stress protein [Opitutaceae bacterium]|nr:universal stress protein [Opitutaceae bacterium]